MAGSAVFYWVLAVPSHTGYHRNGIKRRERESNSQFKEARSLEICDVWNGYNGSGTDLGTTGRGHHQPTPSRPPAGAEGCVAAPQCWEVQAWQRGLFNPIPVWAGELQSLHLQAFFFFIVAVSLGNTSLYLLWEHYCSQYLLAPEAGDLGRSISCQWEQNQMKGFDSERQCLRSSLIFVLSAELLASRP